MEIEVKNRFAIGDRLECVHPAGNHSWQLTRMENAAGKPVDRSGYRVWVELPERWRRLYRPLRLSATARGWRPSPAAAHATRLD
jgi:hypothetical protein